jgi:hypothetical protein
MNNKRINPEKYGMVICPYCNGHGYIQTPKRRSCPKCGGFGFICPKHLEISLKEAPKKTYKTVEFAFQSPEAMGVCITGEFNDWNTQSLPMKKDRDGVWRSKVKLLPGRYEYKLFGDNAWIENLPDAEAIPNPFGTQNFVISVN